MIHGQLGMHAAHLRRREALRHLRGAVKTAQQLHALLRLEEQAASGGLQHRQLPEGGVAGGVVQQRCQPVSHGLGRCTGGARGQARWALDREGQRTLHDGTAAAGAIRAAFDGVERSRADIFMHMHGMGKPLPARLHACPPLDNFR